MLTESQREAALLLGQFAATDSDCKVHIVQRGAVRPLIEMVQSSDVRLKEMSAFAIGRLAQDTHNQTCITYSGALTPLLKLLDSKNGSLQHNAVFGLYGWQISRIMSLTLLRWEVFRGYKMGSSLLNNSSGLMLQLHFEL